MKHLSQHYDLICENYSIPLPLYRSSCATSYHLNQTQNKKKGKKKTDQCVSKLNIDCERANRKTTNSFLSVRFFALLCLFIPCGQTWTPYTRCWSRQARSVETRQTHHLRLPQQNISPPVQHLRQRGLPPIPVPRPPLVRRATKQFPQALERTRRNFTRNFTTDYACLRRFHPRHQSNFTSYSSLIHL